MAYGDFEMRTAGEANSTDPYRPKTIPEWAGCRGAGTAVVSDPNYVFASTIKAGMEKTPYPTGGSGASYVDTVVAVEVNATKSVPGPLG
jgi:hypothetical protein